MFTNQVLALQNARKMLKDQLARGQMSDGAIDQAFNLLIGEVQAAEHRFIHTVVKSALDSGADILSHINGQILGLAATPGSC